MRDLTSCERGWTKELATGKEQRWIEERDGLEPGELDRLGNVVRAIRSRFERGLPP